MNAARNTACATIASDSAVTIRSGVQPAGGCQPNGYTGGGSDESSAYRITSITTPSNLSPTMPSNSSTTLNPSDHRQSLRNRHANANSRRTSSRVGYRSSADGWLTISGIFGKAKMPQPGTVIESKNWNASPGHRNPGQTRPRNE